MPASVLSKRGDSRALRLLVFDFDGTLADTSRVILRSLSQTLQKLGQPVPPAALLKSCIGLPLPRIFGRICGRRDENFISEAVSLYRAIFPENSKGRVSLYPGVAASLEKLHQDGLVLAIASSREKNSLMTLVKDLGIAEKFAVIAGEQEVARHKPAPDIAMLVLARTNIPASCGIFVGDTVFDIGAGRGAGMKSCGVSYGNQSREELARAGADYVIDDFSEILPLVRKLGQARC